METLLTEGAPPPRLHKKMIESGSAIGGFPLSAHLGDELQRRAIVAVRPVMRDNRAWRRREPFECHHQPFEQSAIGDDLIRLLAVRLGDDRPQKLLYFLRVEAGAVRIEEQQSRLTAVYQLFDQIN